MDEDHDRMYVGSKDYLLSLDLHDINKEPLIVRPSVLPCLSLKSGFYMTFSMILYSLSPHQIHWPVAPQRKTECVLSGKDTNVSSDVNSVCALQLLHCDTLVSKTT